jgi:CIC family chloride channel protein
MALGVTGVLTGIAGGLLMKLLELSERLAWAGKPDTLAKSVAATSPLHRVLILAGAGALAGLGMWIIRRKSHGGGGDLSSAIWFRSGRMPLIESLARAVLSIVIVGMGASLGREAAPKEAGATFASALSRWLDITPAQRRLLVACGAGAGMAAVYNVPLGGALFGIEVLLGSIAVPLVIPALLTAFLATATSWLLLPDQPTYKIPTYHMSVDEMIWCAVAGPLMGLASVLYVRAINWAGTQKPKPVGIISSPILSFTLLGALAIAFPQLLGNGKDIVQVAFVDHLGLGLALALMALKPLATVACVASGAPGGLFTPTTSYGALLGVCLGRFWTFFWPGMPDGACAVLGAAAVLAASMEAPLSSMLLVVGLTRHVEDLLAPMMLIITGAMFTKRMFEPHSIYSGRIKIEKMESGDEVLSASPYSVVLERMLELPDGKDRLSVVDERGKPVGKISREALERHPGHVLSTPLETTTAGDLASR